MLINEYFKYLTLLRVLFDFGIDVPVGNRMSYSEYILFEKRVKREIV